MASLDAIPLDLDEGVPLGYALVARLAADHGIRALAIKGPTLSALGLRPPRQSLDVDVLVDPVEFRRPARGAESSTAGPRARRPAWAVMCSRRTRSRCPTTPGRWRSTSTTTSRASSLTPGRPSRRCGGTARRSRSQGRRPWFLIAPRPPPSPCSTCSEAASAARSELEQLVAHLDETLTHAERQQLRRARPRDRCDGGAVRGAAATAAPDRRPGRGDRRRRPPGPSPGRREGPGRSGGW